MIIDSHVPRINRECDEIFEPATNMEDTGESAETLSWHPFFFYRRYLWSGHSYPIWFMKFSDNSIIARGRRGGRRETSLRSHDNFRADANWIHARRTQLTTKEHVLRYITTKRDTLAATSDKLKPDTDNVNVTHSSQVQVIYIDFAYYLARASRIRRTSALLEAIYVP